MTHNELAARIERAEGPDRALDELIHEASGLPFVMEYYTEYATEQTRNLSYVPRYTASIDAAMQLVEGMTAAQIWDIWHRALRDCSRAGADLRTDLARFVSAAALRARSVS